MHTQTLGTKGKGNGSMSRVLTTTREFTVNWGRSMGSRDRKSFQHRKGSFGKHSKGLMLIVFLDHLSYKNQMIKTCLSSKRLQLFVQNFLK